MLRFLRSGPAPPSAPAWIDWSRDMSQSEDGTGDDNADDVDDADQREAVRAPASGPPEIRRKKVWQPFLAPRENAGGKKCRCEFETEFAAACMSDNF